MALYMTQAAYTAEAWAAMTKHPQDRTIPLTEMLQKLGGRLITHYYCFGEYDGVTIFEAPDDIAASAIVLAAVSAGHVKLVKTTRLLTVQEAMEAMGKAGSIVYQAPSKE